MASLEQIGTVSGLIVIDTGYLGVWSHDAAPLLPEGSLDTEEQTSRTNSFMDLRLVGLDAERAGQLRGPEVKKASKQKRTRKMIQALRRLGYRIEPSASQSVIPA